MSPRFTMPGERESARVAALSEIHAVLRALSCAVRLLDWRLGGAAERAIVTSMRRAIRRAEAALRRLPSQKGP